MYICMCAYWLHRLDIAQFSERTHASVYLLFIIYYWEQKRIITHTSSYGSGAELKNWGKENERMVCTLQNSRFLNCCIWWHLKHFCYSSDNEKPSSTILNHEINEINTCLVFRHLFPSICITFFYLLLVLYPPENCRKPQTRWHWSILACGRSVTVTLDQLENASKKQTA